MNDQQVQQLKKRLGEKTHISFTNFAIVPPSSFPPEFASRIEAGTDVANPRWAIQLNDHLFPYEGCENIDRSKFVWGVFGTMSQGEGLFMASSQADTDNSHSLVVQGKFMLNEPVISQVGVDREAVRKSGFLHLERLGDGFREALKEAVLLSGAERYLGFDAATCGRLTLTEIIEAYPALVMDIFEMEESVSVVVHVVRPFWNPWRIFRVCTMRRDPARIKDLNVRFVPQIHVSL